MKITQAESEEALEKYKDKLTSGGKYQVNRFDLHRKTWQAAIEFCNSHEQEKVARSFDDWLKTLNNTLINRIIKCNRGAVEKSYQAGYEAGEINAQKKEIIRLKKENMELKYALMDTLKNAK